MDVITGDNDIMDGKDMENLITAINLIDEQGLTKTHIIPAFQTQAREFNLGESAED